MSRKLSFLVDAQAKQSKEFPFDVPYLTQKEVWQLVALSKQLWLGDLAMYTLEYEEKIPPDVLKKLAPLYSEDGSMRFFQDDFLIEIEACLGAVATNRWKDAILKAAGEGFLKQKQAQWTEERARAHLQDGDIVAKRASTHPDFWELYLKYKQAGRPMTENQLKRWIEIKRIEEVLTPASWFISHCQQEKAEDINISWLAHQAECGVNVQQAQQAHYELFKQATRDLS